MVLALSQVLFSETPKKPDPKDAGLRALAGSEEIKAAITRSKNYKFDKTDPQAAGYLAIYQNNKQTTALVATPKRLYVVLDDVRAAAPKIIRSYSRRKLFGPGNIFTGAITFTERAGKSSGLLTVNDDHKSILLSPTLLDGNPATVVTKFIKHYM